MSLDALKDIAHAEEKCRQEREEAIAQAKRRAAQADEDGRKAVQAAVDKANAEVAQMLRQADDVAENETALLRKSTDGDCQALQKNALERLDAAAAIVVERIVGSDVH